MPSVRSGERHKAQALEKKRVPCPSFRFSRCGLLPRHLLQSLIPAGFIVVAFQFARGGFELVGLGLPCLFHGTVYH